MPIPVRKVFWSLLAGSLLLAAAHLWVSLVPPVSPTGFRYDALISAFNLENEANLPNWYATILLFSIALASLVIFYLRRGGSKWAVFWLGFAVIFLLLSLEEAAQLREVLFHTFFLPAIAAIYLPLGLLLVIGVGVYFFIIKRTDRPLQGWIISGLVVFVLGGVGGGRLHFPIVVKEWLEMFGEILVLCGCLREMNVLLRK